MPQLDRTGKRLRFAQARSAETTYRSTLRGLARQVGVIVRGIAPDGKLKDLAKLIAVLRHYADVIDPWAHAVAEKTLADIARRDKAMWFRNAKEMSLHLRREIEQAPTGAILKDLQRQQIKLIKSIPLDAAERVHELSQKAITSSMRPEDLAQKILEAQAVSQAKADLIARSETSRAAANLVQARAQYAGSPGYIWRISGDLNVRPSHREIDGNYIRWEHPPKTDKGLAPYHAGCGPNCRCFAEPIFPGF